MTAALTSVEAERTAIACVLLYAAERDEVCAALDVVSATDFTDERCRWCFEALRGLFESRSAIDSVMLRMALERRGKLAGVGDEWLIDLVDVLPVYTAAIPAAERVRELAAARERRAEHQTIAALYGAGRIADAEERADALARRGSATVTKSRRMTIAEAAMGPFQRLMGARGGGPIEGERRRITTGIPAFDRVVRGLRARSMVVIGARPSVGKSTLMLQMALGQARAGERPAFISVEDDEDVPGERALAATSGVPLRWVSDDDAQKLTIEQWEALTVAMQTLHDSGGLVVVPYSNRVEVVCAEMRWAVREKGATCLFVDYLQKLRVSAATKTDAVGMAAAAIEEEAESLDVPLVTASQLNRPERGSEWAEPTLERLRNSGEIEQSADAVIMAWHDRPPSVEDEAELIDPRVASFRLAKIKWGSPGALVCMRRAPSGEFAEVDDSYDCADAAQ